MRKILIVLFLYVLAEISLLIYVGGRIGALNMVLLLLVSMFFGVWMVKKQGLSILQEIRFDLSRRVVPGAALLDGLCLLVGGFLLVAPGLISDAAGLMLLIPSLRSRVNGWFRAWIKDRISRGTFTFISFRR